MCQVGYFFFFFLEILFFWDSFLDATTLQVTVGSDVFSCTFANQVFKSQVLLNGTIRCPDPTYFCNPDGYLASWPKVVSVSPNAVRKIVAKMLG